MILDELDNGRTVSLSAGSTFYVRLKENPTTGYRWSHDTIEGIEWVSDHYKLSDADAGIGAESIRIFEFRATKCGSYHLKMKHWREWEGESSSIDRFQVKINVT